MPFLGWKEFAPSYFGEFRESTNVQTDINMVIPSMLREVFPKATLPNVPLPMIRM